MFTLSQFPLPFAENALAPYISEQTVRTHYGKHLATYIKNLNDLISNTPWADLPLHEIIRRSARDENARKIFNNSAQIFNHDFFFHCLHRGNTRNIPYDIAVYFGGADKFRTQFYSAALSVFGSGWVWLTQDAGGFKIITTQNADTPVVHGMRPLLTLDVWEHAYYLDYQNRRGEYIDAFLDNLINWDFVVENMNL